MLRRVQGLSGKHAAMVVVETGDALGTVLIVIFAADLTGGARRQRPLVRD
jgi:hypothetical protein